MARKSTRQPLSVAELARRLQSIAINAAEGQRSIADDRQYTQIRRGLDKDDVGLPRLVSVHPTVDSLVAELKRYPKHTRPQFVREEFETFIQRVEGTDGAAPHDASTWTGIQAPAAKLRAVRELLPLARASIEVMIEALSEPGPNGGPLLDEREVAIECLRELHRTLGELLAAADSGHLEDELGEGLAAEAVRYAKRFGHSVTSDPMPYAASALILGILGACGFPEAGAYLGGLAVSVRKSIGK